MDQDTTAAPTTAPTITPARSRYGLSLLVACGWYGTVTAAMVVGTLSVPDGPPPTECPGFGTCLGPGAQATILALVLGMAGIVLLPLTALVTAPLARRVPSAVLAGTLAAAVSVSVAAAAVAAYAGTR